MLNGLLIISDRTGTLKQVLFFFFLICLDDEAVSTLGIVLPAKLQFSGKQVPIFPFPQLGSLCFPTASAGLCEAGRQRRASLQEAFARASFFIFTSC